MDCIYQFKEDKQLKYKIMDITTIIITAITALTTIVPVYLKVHNGNTSIRKAISDKDKKQDEEMLIIKSLVEDVKGYIDKINYKTTLSTKMRASCNSIIVANSLDNVEFISLLNNSRDKYIEAINNILDINIKELDIDIIKSDMLTFAKYIKTITNFNNIDTPDSNCLYLKLRNDVVYPIIQTFLMRLEDEIIKDTNKYNGTFEKIALSCINNLITNIIKAYRDSKK
jgi:hypothetical protein